MGCCDADELWSLSKFILSSEDLNEVKTEPSGGQARRANGVVCQNLEGRKSATALFPGEPHAGGSLWLGFAMWRK